MKTKNAQHASVIGAALMLVFSSAMLRGGQAQQEPAHPAQPEAQQPTAGPTQDPQAPAEAETLHVLLGRPFVVSSPAPIRGISVADPGVIDVEALNRNDILINGVGPGSASLVVTDATGQSQAFDINVECDPLVLPDQLMAALQDQPASPEAPEGKRAWIDWIVIASIILVGGTILGAKRKRGRPRLYRLELQAPGANSPGAGRGTEVAVEPAQARAEDIPAEETVTDVLTGLKTYRYFMQALDEEWRVSARYGHPFSVIMMDLDGFKQVNDQGGHSEGDRVLTTVATLLDAQSRQPDVVARYGEDEFAILTPETNTQQAEILAERLRAAVEKDKVLSAHAVTASIGIATFPDHGRTPEETLKVADSEMHLAKQSSGNCVKVSPVRLEPGNAERNERLLETYLGVAVEGAPSTAPRVFTGDRRRLEKLKPLREMLTALAFAVDAKGPYMTGHSQAVSRLAARIATQVGLPAAEVEETRLAGLVHDIGKIHVPEAVCNKPDQLTAEEFELMSRHSAWGAKMLEPLNVKAIERIVRHHHERFDGKGYPDGLAADKIPLGARIVVVAESFHSMLSELPYRSARTFEDALAELRRCSGMQFDPKVVMIFLDWVQMSSTLAKELDQRLLQHENVLRRADLF